MQKLNNSSLPMFKNLFKIKKSKKSEKMESRKDKK